MSNVIMLHPSGRYPRPERVRIATEIQRAHLRAQWLEAIAFCIPQTPGHFLAGLPDLYGLPDEMLADPLANAPKRLGRVLGIAAGKTLMAHWEHGGDARFYQCYEAIQAWIQPAARGYGGEVFEGARQAIHDLAMVLQGTRASVAKVCQSLRTISNGTLTIAGLSAIHGYRCTALKGVFRG